MNICFHPKGSALEKVLLVMKLTAILIVVFSLQVSADVLAQKIQLRVKNAPLQEVLQEIRKQSGYSVMAKSELLEQALPVSVHINESELEEALAAIFRHQPITYEIKDGLIVLKETRKSNTITHIDGLVLAYTEVRGQVVDSLGNPLQGASVRVLNSVGQRTQLQTVTDRQGEFLLRSVPQNASLEISYVGYIRQEVKAAADIGVIVLKAEPNEIEAVEVVVSTGYQELPITATTGSYTVVDSALYNRSTGSDILSRLNHVTSGLAFNKNKYAAENSISIRGMNTIFSEAEPLIVLDNYPYEGDINLINPHDVESITILKDAAAASIWGAKAGNGVIVINTRKGKAMSKPLINFHANVRMKEKPDLLYEKRLQAADYIAKEQRLFEEGYYQADELSYDHKPLSQAVEQMIALRDGKISQAEFDQSIAYLKTGSLRSDVAEYLYRPATAQQYALSFSGGTDMQRYYISGGLDRSLSEKVGDATQRYTLNFNQDLNFFNNRLRLSHRVGYTENNVTANAPQFTYSLQPPYAKLVGENGEYLPVIINYRQLFVEEAMADGLLDWAYNPVADMPYRDYSTKSHYFRFNPIVEFSITKDLKIEGNYQFASSAREQIRLERKDSYFARDLVNQYSDFNAKGELVRPIPYGGILERYPAKSIEHYWRGQIHYKSSWSSQHQIQAIAGAEQRKNETKSSYSRVYGYEEEFGHGVTVDATNYYPIYHNPYMTRKIYMPSSMNELHDNYRSFYANANYTWNGKYIFSGSVRLDQSNLFGVKTNQKGVPLYSAGVSWKLSDEDFYSLDFLPHLRIRASFGYNGNVNKTVSALPTAIYYDANNSALERPYAEMQNPPNSMLRWEKVRIWNTGLDFGLPKAVLTGTLEFFSKAGMDLIGTMPYRPSSGIMSFTGNFANTKGKGFDLALNSKNLQGQLGWNTSFLLSHVRDYVSRYDEQANVSDIINYSDGLIKTPVEGRPLYAVYSYKSGGLTHDTGDPIGYINGEPSQDYSAIIAGTTLDELVYNGPVRPTWFGALRNTFQYKQVRLSFNISYSFGYYFRKQSFGYGQTYGLGANADYYQRWQSPGDEQHTFVPSMTEEYVANRDRFYLNSSVLVDKGDNIRLEDIRLDWNVLSSIRSGAGIVKNLDLFFYANQLGILWKKNRFGLDPDYPLIPMQKQFSIGIQANL